MIRFNSYDVACILFIKKEKYFDFAALPSNGRAAAILADPASYYKYDGAFSAPDIDPEKIHDPDNLTEAIYIQEVRVNVKLNSWMETNIFRKENDYILSNTYKYKYKYVDIFNAERRNLPEATGLCNKMCLLLNKNNEILFVGFIDISENTIAPVDQKFDLKLCSFSYLLNLVKDIEVCMYNKSNVYEYNLDGQFGLNGFKWPTGAWDPYPLSGERLRHPSNIINLYILEAMRFYFGDTADSWLTSPGTGGRRQLINHIDFQMTAKTGVILIQNAIASPSVMYDGHYHDFYEDISFLYGNYIYLGYRFFETVPVGNQQVDMNYYLYYKLPVSDDLEILSTDKEFVKYFGVGNYTVPQNFSTQFKNHMGFDFPNTQAKRWDEWADGGFYCRMKIIAQNTTYNLIYEYNLPVPLDFDICESGSNAKGIMIKLGDLLQAACAAEMCYIDVEQDAMSPFRCKRKKILTITESNQEEWYDDKIVILSKKRMVLNRDSFDSFDILNQGETLSLMVKKIYRYLYNKKLYNAALEEIVAMVPRIVSPDSVCNFTGHGKFLITQVQPVYDQNGFKFSTVTMWRLSYAN